MEGEADDYAWFGTKEEREMQWHAWGKDVDEDEEYAWWGEKENRGSASGFGALWGAISLLDGMGRRRDC